MSFENMIGEQEDTGLDVNTGGEYAGFPLIMWLNGDPGAEKLGINSLEYAGGFFTSPWYRHGATITQRIPEGADATEYPEIDLTPFGWRKDYFTAADKKRVDGWYRQTLEAAFICGRERWVIMEESKEGKKKYLSFANYKDAAAVGSPRGNKQALALVKGMEAMGPVVLSFKGYAMKSFNGQSELMADGVMSGLRKYVTDPVAIKLTPAGNKKAPHINYRSVWCPIGPKIENGKPAFIKAGKGEKSKWIVVPCYLGERYTKENIALDKVYVGDDVNTQANETFEANLEWAKAWANLNGEAEGAGQDDAKVSEKTVETKSLTAMATTAGL